MKSQLPLQTGVSKHQLKAQAHSLKVILQMGKEGLTESFKKAVDNALRDHPLLKIRVNVNDREEYPLVITTLCDYCQATFIQRMGHVVILYRPQEK